MFCPNCGAENVKGTKFCKNCGTTLTSNEKVEVVPKINTEDIKKKVKSIPKKVIAAIVAAAVVVATALVFLSLPPTIDINKYIVYEFTGYDGYGEYSMSIDWFTMKEDYANKIKWTKEADQMGIAFSYDDGVEFLKDAIHLNHDNIDSLSNGDVIPYSFEYDEETIKDFLKCNIKSTDDSLTVQGLNETKKIDFFSFDLNELITYTGPDKSTDAFFSKELDGYQIYKDDDYVVVLTYENSQVYASFIQNNTRVCTVSYSMENNRNLSNGDIISLEVSARSILEYGYAPLSTTAELVVSDRPSLINKDMFSFEATWGVAYDLIPSDYWGGGQYSEPELYQVCILEAKETAVTDTTSIVLFTCSFEYTDRRGNAGEPTYYYVLVNNPYYQEKMLYESIEYIRYTPEKFSIDDIISDLEKDYNVYPVYGF